MIYEDFSNQKILFTARTSDLPRVVEVGCMTNAWRKFRELHASHSRADAVPALALILEHHDIE